MTKQATELNGRYRLEALLGEGGMARVYQGLDLVLGRTVAIKVLAPPFDRDESFVARFRREAKAAASLNHPNIVAIFDTGSDAEAHYIVMEFVDGATLHEVIAREAPMPVERASGILASVCGALAAAHRVGVVHRDVKPGNVMLTRAGHVKVADFGIARTGDAETLTRSGVVLGTASYVAPEQARGGPVDARTDLYSLGCVAYEMVTGQPPFPAESALAALYRHVNDPVIRPAEIGPVPPAIESVILRCLEKDPDDRYQSAGELADAIRSAAIVPGLGPITEPVVLPDRTAELPPVEPSGLRSDAAFPRRGALIAWAVAALIALGLILLGIAVTAGRPGPDAKHGAAGGTRASLAASPSTASPDGRPSSSPPLTVSAAYSALTGLIEQGQQLGQLSDGVAKDLLHRADDLLRDYQKGDAEEVADKAGELQDKLGELADHGLDPALAEDLRVAIGELVAAMNASPSPESDGKG